MTADKFPIQSLVNSGIACPTARTEVQHYWKKTKIIANFILVDYVLHVMAKMENVSVDDLEDALENAEGKGETQRLMVAILYKRGPSVPMIAEWLDMRDGTIYEWLNRFEARPIEDAITDDHRPGRPPKLDDAGRKKFEVSVNKPPTENGYDQEAWSTKLAQRFLREEFDVDYSIRHIARLLNGAGLSPQTPRTELPTSADGERSVFWEPVNGTGELIS